MSGILIYLLGVATGYFQRDNIDKVVADARSPETLLDLPLSSTEGEENE